MSSSLSVSLSGNEVNSFHVTLSHVQMCANTAAIEPTHTVSSETPIPPTATPGNLFFCVLERLCKTDVNYSLNVYNSSGTPYGPGNIFWGNILIMNSSF